MSWRDTARPIIARVISETGTDDMKALRRALSDAYPFGPKSHFPYRIWCDEINAQLKSKVQNPVIEGQKDLFE